MTDEQERKRKAQKEAKQDPGVVPLQANWEHRPLTDQQLNGRSPIEWRGGDEDRWAQEILRQKIEKGKIPLSGERVMKNGELVGLVLTSDHTDANGKKSFLYEVHLEKKAAHDAVVATDDGLRLGTVPLGAPWQDAAAAGAKHVQVDFKPAGRGTRIDLTGLTDGAPVTSTFQAPLRNVELTYGPRTKGTNVRLVSDAAREDLARVFVPESLVRDNLRAVPDERGGARRVLSFGDNRLSFSPGRGGLDASLLVTRDRQEKPLQVVLYKAGSPSESLDSAADLPNLLAAAVEQARKAESAGKGR